MSLLARVPDASRPTASGRRALVMGLGAFGGGVGATRHLARLGWDVTVTDHRDADALRASVDALRDVERLELVLGTHREEDFDAAELVVANPAVAPDHPLLARARAAGARVTSEIELFLEAVRARVVCITGTQGKSSTTTLVHGLLAANRDGARAHLGGNLGGSLLASLDAIAPRDFVVLELSSYQLDALADPAALGASIERVEAVAVTNVLPDHLERHGSLEAYAAAKRRVLDLLGDGGLAVLPSDERFDAWAPRRGRAARFAAFDRSDRGTRARFGIEAEAFVDRAAASDAPLAQVRHLALPGRFQRANALVALAIAAHLGIDDEARERALREVRGLPHRLEALGTFAGRRVHDNGVSTTPDSTIAALESLPEGCHLIVGGRMKELALDELARVASTRVARAVCFGEARDTLADELARAGVDVARVASVEDAVADALAHAPVGSDVLFSPACASFDAYGNFRERALAFRAALPAPDPTT